MRVFVHVHARDDAGRYAEVIASCREANNNYTHLQLGNLPELERHCPDPEVIILDRDKCQVTLVSHRNYGRRIFFGDAVALHELLGKALGAFQLRRGLRGAHDAQAAGAVGAGDLGLELRRLLLARAAPARSAWTYDGL